MNRLSLPITGARGYPSPRAVDIESGPTSQRLTDILGDRVFTIVCSIPSLREERFDELRSRLEKSGVITAAPSLGTIALELTMPGPDEMPLELYARTGSTGRLSEIEFTGMGILAARHQFEPNRSPYAAGEAMATVQGHFTNGGGSGSFGEANVYKLVEL